MDWPILQDAVCSLVGRHPLLHLGVIAWFFSRVGKPLEALLISSPRVDGRVVLLSDQRDQHLFNERRSRDLGRTLTSSVNRAAASVIDLACRVPGQRALQLLLIPGLCKVTSSPPSSGVRNCPRTGSFTGCWKSAHRLHACNRARELAPVFCESIEGGMQTVQAVIRIMRQKLEVRPAASSIPFPPMHSSACEG